MSLFLSKGFFQELLLSLLTSCPRSKGNCQAICKKYWGVTWIEEMLQWKKVQMASFVRKKTILNQILMKTKNWKMMKKMKSCSTIPKQRMKLRMTLQCLNCKCCGKIKLNFAMGTEVIFVYIFYRRKTPISEMSPNILCSYLNPSSSSNSVMSARMAILWWKCRK